MTDLERDSLCEEIIENLDTLDDLIENNVDLDEDEQMSEVSDLIEQIRNLILKE